jgi:hypothetical protein
MVKWLFILDWSESLMVVNLNELYNWLVINKVENIKSVLSSGIKHFAW